jgi:hypothetical protein
MGLNYGMMHFLGHDPAKNTPNLAHLGFGGQNRLKLAENILLTKCNANDAALLP